MDEEKRISIDPRLMHPNVIKSLYGYQPRRPPSPRQKPAISPAMLADYKRVMAMPRRMPEGRVPQQPMGGMM